MLFTGLGQLSCQLYNSCLELGLLVFEPLLPLLVCFFFRFFYLPEVTFMSGLGVFLQLSESFFVLLVRLLAFSLPISLGLSKLILLRLKLISKLHPDFLHSLLNAFFLGDLGLLRVLLYLLSGLLFGRLL